MPKLTAPAHPGRAKQALSARSRASQYDIRKSQRLAIALPVHVIVGPSSRAPASETTSLNVSGGGLRVALPKSVPKNAQCHLTIGLPKPYHAVSFTARVAWTAQPPGGKCCHAGLEFMRPADHDGFVQYCHFIASQLVCHFLQPQTVGAS